MRPEARAAAESQGSPPCPFRLRHRLGQFQKGGGEAALPRKACVQSRPHTRSSWEVVGGCPLKRPFTFNILHEDSFFNVFPSCMECAEFMKEALKWAEPVNQADTEKYTHLLLGLYNHSTQPVSTPLGPQGCRAPGPSVSSLPLCVRGLWKQPKPRLLLQQVKLVFVVLSPSSSSASARFLLNS